ncbi:hypothetical protein DSO57_1022596 [Entomophthora muscae]|uniref:Uncharacterized protein n=1 Tax=Entomophthora muscae TaxID=34485 RepID=A0ACC2UP95_9FUNG|nr:hypothetical protein DSO57_1022596 [Entomophthora muscae]
MPVPASTPPSPAGAPLAINQSSSSQASFNGGKSQNVEAPIYTQAFEAGNKEADLYLIPDPYGFDLFNSHLVSSSSPAPVPTLAQTACQPTNQDGNPDLEHLPANSQPAPLSQSGFSSHSPAPQATNNYCPNSQRKCGTEPSGPVLGSDS